MNDVNEDRSIDRSCSGESFLFGDGTGPAK